MSDFERIVELTPAFDRRDPDPAKNYGIHGVELRMVLKGPEGAVQFVVYTNWQLPHVQRETDERTLLSCAAGHMLDAVDLRVRYHPQPADVGYHSPRAMYEGHSPIQNACPFLDGRACYYDGSGLRAEEWFNKILLPQGSDGIWKAMEAEYDALFGAHALEATDA